MGVLGGPMLPHPPSWGSRPLTWSEVMSPLAAAVHLIHSDATQQVCVVGFLQTRHKQLALGNLLWSHVHQLESGLWIHHSSHDCLGVLLWKKKKKKSDTFCALVFHYERCHFTPNHDYDKLTQVTLFGLSKKKALFSLLYFVFHVIAIQIMINESTAADSSEYGAAGIKYLCRITQKLAWPWLSWHKAYGIFQLFFGECQFSKWTQSVSINKSLVV